MAISTATMSVTTLTSGWMSTIWTSIVMTLESTTTMSTMVMGSFCRILCTFPIYFRHTLTVAVARDELLRLFNLKSNTRNTVLGFITKSLHRRTSLTITSSSMSLIQWCERFLFPRFVIESFIICLQTGWDRNLRSSSSTIIMQDERGGGHSLAFAEQKNLCDKSHTITRNQHLFSNWILRAILEVFQKRGWERK